MDGVAIIEPLLGLEVNRPRTEGGLDRHDLEDLADVVEVLVRTRTDLTDEDREIRLLGIDNIRALLRYKGLNRRGVKK